MQALLGSSVVVMGAEDPGGGRFVAWWRLVGCWSFFAGAIYIQPKEGMRQGKSCNAAIIYIY